MNIPLPNPVGLPPPMGVPSPTPLPQGANPYGVDPSALANASPPVQNMAASPPPVAAQAPLAAQAEAPQMPLLHDLPYGDNAHGIHPDVSPKEVADYLLPRFRDVESSGNYKATNKDSTASGAYQYIDPTWGKYKGFTRAMDAPPEIQDQRMREDILKNLTQFKGDPFKTIAAHYYPAWANDPKKWQQIPVNKYGKEISGAQTISQYVSKVLKPERVNQYLAQLG